MMVVTSPKLSAFVLAAIPIIVLPLYAAGRSVRERSRRAQDRLADATAFATESLSAVRVMQSFLAEQFTASRYRDAAFGAYEAARAMTQARAIVTAAALFLAFGSVVVVLWLGAQEVIARKMTGGRCRSSCCSPCSARARLDNCRKYGTRFRKRRARPAASARSWRSSRASSRPLSRSKLAKPVRGEFAFHDRLLCLPGA